MSNPFLTRLQRAQAAMGQAGVEALLIGPGADLRYLTGYVALPLERMTLLVVRADGGHTLVVPELEAARAHSHGVAAPVESFGETADPFALVARLLQGADGGTIGVGDQLWSVFLLGLQAALPSARWTRATAILRELRMRKAADELDALRRAAQTIDRVHRRVPAMLRPGRTEAEIAREIVDAMLEEGHAGVDFTIVGSGPNGASPHHESSDRVIARGDAVVVDIGGPMPDGYFSDCTRNYVVGEAPEGYLDAHEALATAQRAACAAVRPGVTAAAVDEAARAVLREAGYEEWFIHRTGHGIGLDVHEDPYIVAGNELALEAGMTFSIEPGIYLPGRFGLRIEDIVAVTDDGVERLNTLDREAVLA